MSRRPPDHKPDDSQLAVIHARENAIRLVAPAGSGKTETLVRRVIERTGQEEVDPRRILMLTFDNNGKQAFSRLLKAFAPRQVLPRFHTFNSFGLSILKEYFPQENVQKVSDADLGPFRRSLRPLPILRWDDRVRDPLETFRAMKEHGLRPMERDRREAMTWLRASYLELPAENGTLELTGNAPIRPSSTDAEIAGQLSAVFDAYLDYEQELRRRNRMDWQDQKLRALMRLIPRDDILARLRQTYDEVIIDEAQDISRLDALLIWSAIGDQTIITLAGDDDQTIYEFRQASSVFLRDAARYFQRDFTTYQLNINYRSPEAILDPAQRLIAHNVERIEKGVTSARPEPGEVIVHTATSDGDRIARLVDTVRDLQARGFDWADIGILTPQGWQLNAIKAALDRARVPTKINTGRNDTGVIEPAVELSTIHKAKGRQWRAVLLPMSGEGEMPTLQSVQQGMLEAERRAFYVSMSRAADVLVVSYIRTGEHPVDTIDRSLSGEITGTSGASRFLFESGLVLEQRGRGIEEPREAVSDADRQAPEPPDEPTAPEQPPIVPEPGPQAARQSVADRLRQKDPEAQRNLGRTRPQAPDTAPPSPASPEAAVPVPPTATAKPSRAERAQRRIAEEASRQGTVIPAHILRLVEAAERKHAEQDYRYALFDGWDAVYQTLRLLEPGIAAEKGDAYGLINELAADRRVPADWVTRLHDWRITRNKGLKENTYREKGIDDLIDGLRPFMAIAAAALGGEAAAISAAATPSTQASPVPIVVAGATSARPPVQIYPLPTAQAYATARMLANGGFDPERGKTIRTIGIHTLNHGVEFLPLQLGLILLDVKFFVPGTYRYANSPIFARYCHGHADVRLPADLRPLVRQPSEVSPEVERRIHGLLDEMLHAVVAHEGYRGKPGAILDKRLRDAMRLANGSVNRGVRLEPMDASRGAGWSKS